MWSLNRAEVFGTEIGRGEERVALEIGEWKKRTKRVLKKRGKKMKKQRVLGDGLQKMRGESQEMEEGKRVWINFFYPRTKRQVYFNLLKGWGH